VFAAVGTRRLSPSAVATTDNAGHSLLIAALVAADVEPTPVVAVVVCDTRVVGDALLFDFDELHAPTSSNATRMPAARRTRGS